MAFHSRPYRASALRNRLCSSSVQYSRRLVSTYFLRVVFAAAATTTAAGCSCLSPGVVAGVDDDIPCVYVCGYSKKERKIELVIDKGGGR